MAKLEVGWYALVLSQEDLGLDLDYRLFSLGGWNRCEISHSSGAILLMTPYEWTDTRRMKDNAVEVMWRV